MHKFIHTFLVGTLITVSLCLIMYGIWWLAKNGSYFLWYEDMVIETIKDTVKQEALK